MQEALSELPYLFNNTDGYNFTDSSKNIILMLRLLCKLILMSSSKNLEVVDGLLGDLGTA